MKFFTLLNDESIHPSAHDKVIPSSEFGTLLSGKELMEMAQEQYDAFQIQLEEDRKKALQRGYEDGYDQGLKKLNEHLLEFDTRLKEIRMEMQNQVLSFSLKAAKKIVGKTFELHPEIILEIVKETLKPVREAYSVKIAVSKEDRTLVESKKAELKELLDHAESLVIEERADIEKGGCIIETESGIINATLENQWRALEAAFTRMAKQ